MALLHDTLPLLGPALRAHIEAMTSTEAVAHLLAGMALMAGLQAVPVLGEAADAAFLAMAYAYAGWDGLLAVVQLVEAVHTAVEARSEAEIAAAAPGAAAALVTLGGAFLDAVALRMAKRNTSGGGKKLLSGEQETEQTVNPNRGQNVGKSARPAVTASNRSPLSQDTIRSILSTAKGSRPDPSSYLSDDYIDAHLAQFDAGGTKLAAGTPSPVVGPPGGTFVMPKSVADDAISQSGGDVSKLESLLSLEPGDLGQNPMRIDIPSPTGLRMPSGRELGANDQWIPGGFTGGGIPEATIDPAPPGTYSVNPVFP